MVKVEVNFNPQKDSKVKQTTKRHDLQNANPTGTQWGNQFHKAVRKLVLAGDTPDFDPTTIDHWRDEGFTVGYLPYNGDPKEYSSQLKQLCDPLSLGDKWALIAFGDAAAVCLEACMKPLHKLVSLIAYYPTWLPDTQADYPPSLLVQIHLAGTQLGMPRSDFPNLLPFVYNYPDSHPGFAEHDLDEFDKTSSRLSWSRSLCLIYRTFGIYRDLESIWENHTALEFVHRDADKTMATMVPEPYVNHIPTMTGGIGSKDLHRFYSDYFIPSNPPDTSMKLLSRTVGTDRVVDEMFFGFTHTTPVPWMLPGIPPTGKRVEVALVSVVCIRGSKLYHEHIYWDQASVLVQVGLLDPKLIPQGFKTSEEGKEKEVERLPVVGREGVMKVVDEEEGRSNDLIPDW